MLFSSQQAAQVLQSLGVRYSTKVPPRLPTTIRSPLKSVSAQRASRRGLCPDSLCLCSSLGKNPLRCSDSHCKGWKSLVYGGMHGEVRPTQKASSEPLRNAAAGGPSGVCRCSGSGPQQGGQGPGCWSCSPPETGSSG